MTAPVRAAPPFAATDTLIEAGDEPFDGVNDSQLAVLDAVHEQPVSVMTSNRRAPPAAPIPSPDRLRE
jgi:hypothetical protein